MYSIDTLFTGDLPLPRWGHYDPPPSGVLIREANVARVKVALLVNDQQHYGMTFYNAVKTRCVISPSTHQ